MYPEGDLAWKSKAPNQQGVEYLSWGIGTSRGGGGAVRSIVGSGSGIEWACPGTKDLDEKWGRTRGLTLRLSSELSG